MPHVNEQIAPIQTLQYPLLFYEATGQTDPRVESNEDSPLYAKQTQECALALQKSPNAPGQTLNFRQNECDPVSQTARVLAQAAQVFVLVQSLQKNPHRWSHLFAR
ncbi:MAG: hypothetical protein AAF320_00545 [Myxococcota bacterium]